MSTVNAKINWITYYNEENYYAVLACTDDEEKFSVLGNIPNPVRGQEYSFDGEWITHPKYGRQFKASGFHIVVPTSSEGIVKLLKSGVIKGIGPVTAERIVKHFGEESMDIIANHPDRLIEVKGIGKKVLDKIAYGWKESQEVIELQKFLQDCGVSISLAPKIYKQYGADSIQTIQDNPYILTQELWGVGFRTADLIAKEVGLSPVDENRIKAGIIHVLKSYSMSGHCFERANAFITDVSNFLHIGYRDVALQLRHMLDTKDSIIEEEENIYLKSFYYAELGIAKKLFEVVQFEGFSAFADIDNLEEVFGIKYDEIQIEAIKNAVKNKVAVITGGPGTGKTTIIRAIVKAFTDCGRQVVLASPTGRAANRMAEVVGMEAKTIHRLLEYSPMGSFTRDEENPIEGDVLVLDECSMIDIQLMHSLLKAVPPHMNIILVGDIDQLPSVGPGNVLADIIDSGCFYVAKLEKVFRQAEESDIIMNAHRINKGLPIILRNRDVKLIQTNDIQQTILNIVTKSAVPSEVQVLSPVKKTDFGTNELNNIIQDALNHREVVVERKYTKYRLGDRVMQIRNNYEKNVFNGTLGVIESYDRENNKLTVDFGETVAIYDNSDLDELMLAYAITVHKSQGSEFPTVIIPLSMQHKSMLQRNLIYTAFTRPTQKLYLVGDKNALDYAIGNTDSKVRRTRLVYKIRQWFANM